MTKFIVTTGFLFQTIVYAASASEAKKIVACGAPLKDFRARKA